MNEILEKKQVLYASFNARLIASIIDVFISMILLLPITRLMDYLIFGKNTPGKIWQTLLLESIEKFPEQPDKRWDYIAHNPTFIDFIHNNGLIKIALESLLQIGFFMTLMVISWNYMQTSPGKMMMSLKIIDADTLGKPSKKQYIIRFLGYFFIFGFIWIFFNKKKQAWHDIIANTFVVKK
jgi:uncharacterized RDD family membrane protein YckC